MVLASVVFGFPNLEGGGVEQQHYRDMDKKEEDSVNKIIICSSKLSRVPRFEL
jgi:hypothetical protein